MALHPLAQRFESVAGEYERGRPEYPEIVVAMLAAEFDLSPGAPVLDLAAGTGKLSRALLAGGFEVTAVEPLGPLRTLVAERIGAERALSGVAESIPLPDEAVEAVTVADAFHWFDAPTALAEIRRVLRPGGGLAVLVTVPDWSGTTWAHELGTLVAEMRPAHPFFDGPPWQDAVHAAGGWSAPRQVRVTTRHATSAERIVDHLTSMSWVAGMPDEERAAAIERFRTLVASGETPPELPVHFLLGLTTRLT